ncbi:MAG: DUF6034 family protein [Clostridia bacterium]|nr:DUF6034 family protein [Clostridia bacterium]
MKRAWIIALVTILLLTGCQPTPEEDVVFNRGDTDVDAIIAASPLPTRDATQSASPTSGASQSDEPEYDEATEGQNPIFPARYENELSNDATSLTIDAEVITNGLTSYPVYEVRRADFDAEQVRAMAGEIITDIVGVRDGTGFVKSDYPILMEKATVWGDNSVLTWLSQEMQAAEDVEYREANELCIEESIENQTYRRSDGTTGFVSANGAFLTISRHSGVGVLNAADAHDVDIIYGRTPTPIAPELTQQEAENILFDFLERAGLEGYVVGSAEPARLISDKTTGTISEGWRFEVVRTFEYYPISVSEKDQGSAGFLQPRDGDIPYSPPWYPEYMRVYIDAEGVANFLWQAPVEIIGVANENVRLADFDTVTKSAMNLFSAAFAWYQKHYEENNMPWALCVKIEKIILTVTLQQAKNRQGTAYLLPTWIFLVDLYSIPELGGNFRYQEAYGFSAIDGTRVPLNLWS